MRLIAQEDAAELFALVDSNRSHLSEWLTWLDSMSDLSSAERYIQSRAALAAEQKGLCFVIRSEGQLVGLCHLVGIDLVNKTASIGYWVGAAHRRRGLAKKAVRELMEHAFRTLGLNRVEIRCATGNAASRAIPVALGFREEGTLRASEWLHDRFVDHVVYGVLRDEWLGGIE